MYIRTRPDSHRFLVGGSFSCLLFWFQIVGHLTSQYYCKSNWHVAHQWRDLIVNIQRSRTPKVFEMCLIPLQSVLITDSDESWHTLCVHLLNVSFSPTAYSEIVAQQRSMPKCTIIVSQLVSFLSNFFFSIFSLDATLKCILLSVILSRFGHHPGYYTTIDFWSGLAHASDLDLVTAYATIPQLTSDPVSHTHQIYCPCYYATIDFWSSLAHPSDAKSSVISQMSLSQYYMFSV